MKRIAGTLLLVLGLLAGFVRWLDLVNFTDLSTGFVLEGSVWLRYALVAGLVLAAALGAQMAARRPQKLEERAVLLSGGTFITAAAFAALGGIELFDAVSDGTFGIGLVYGVLCILTAWWMASMAVAWGGRGMQGGPAGGVAVAIPGGMVFCLLVLERFVQNSSSWYRVGATCSVFAALSALLLAATLARAVCFARSRVGYRLFFFGMLTFYLCTCIDMPQAVCDWMAGSIPFARMAQSAALGLLGILGALCAQASLGQEAEG